MDWTSGYVTEIDYTHGYYRELAPGLIDYALLIAGYEAPKRSGMRYLELGYGQGLSANIHAAAAPGEYWGTDFNPAHASNSQTLAQTSGADAHFFDDSFADLSHRADLPTFDYIVLHGIWSWVSDENRRVITGIMRDRLKVGGAVYFSYNSLPGWAAAMPLRHMMSIHMEAAGTAAQGLVSRIDGSIAFGKSLIDVGARYFASNPSAKTRLEMIAGQNRNYLAHEYSSRDWSPMYFAEVHEWLSEAKLSYATFASPLEQMDAYNLTEPQQRLINEIGYDVLRETVRDYVLNQQFRRDLYTRGARRLTALERFERWSDVRLMLTVPAADIPFEVDAGLGKVGLRQEVYRPIIEALAKDDGSPKRLGDLADLPELATFAPGALIEVTAVLVGSGRAHPVQSETDIAVAKPRCDRLNAYLVSRARLSNDVSCLASPVIGGGIPIARFEQMFLDARLRGKKKPADWAADAWGVLAKQNQSLLKDGAPLRSAEENLGELKRLAEYLSDHHLPLYRQLGIVD
jgi:hypothetical protein